MLLLHWTHVHSESLNYTLLIGHEYFKVAFVGSVEVVGQDALLNDRQFCGSVIPRLRSDVENPCQPDLKREMNRTKHSRKMWVQLTLPVKLTCDSGT